MNYEKSLQDVIFDMICDPDYMFYSLFIVELNKSFSDDPNLTACAAKHKSSNNIELIFGKKFWTENCKNSSQKRAVVIHELMHVIYEHLGQIYQGMFPDKKIANYAMDCYINQLIKEQSPENEDGSDVFIYPKDFPELNLENNKHSVYYYYKFMDAKKEKENSKGKKDSLSGPAGNKQGSSGCKTLDQIIDQDIDIHKSWDTLMEGMTPLEQELFSKQLRGMIERVAEETTKSAGRVPIDIQTLISNMVHLTPPVISWKNLFAKFVGSCTSTEQYQTRKKPNLRFEESPSLKNKTKIKGLVAIDSSGSMSTTEIDEINSQLYHIWKTGTKVDFTTWDGDCDIHKQYNGKLDFTRTKAGGTLINSAIEYVNDNFKKNQWSFAVIGTDGFVGDPQIIRCKIPCLIVLTKNGNLNLKAPQKIIKIN